MDGISNEMLAEIKGELNSAVNGRPAEAVVEEVVDEPTEDIVAEETPEEVVEEDAVEEAVEEDAIAAVAEDEPYTMKSLAEAIEIDQSDLYGVMIPMGDHGEPISIGDIKNKYTDLIKENKDLSNTITEQKSAIESGTSMQEQHTMLSQQEVQAQVEMAAIQQEYDSTDWIDMDEFEPGQSALKRQKLQERYQAAQGVFAQAQQLRSQETQTNLAAAQEKMLELIPSWTDTDKKQADISMMSAAMRDAGYGEDIINNIQDPIAMMLMQELVSLRSEKAKAVKAVKQVRKAPKPLKSGNVATPKKAAMVDKLINQAKQTGNKHDAFNAVKALLAGQG